MKKLTAFGAGAAIAASAAVTTALLGAGVAGADPNLVGYTYSDVAGAIENAGGTAKVAAKVGSQLEEGDCIVTNTWNAPSFDHTGGVIMVSLNCDGDHATAEHPGASVASPAGRQAKAAADRAAALEQQQLQQQQRLQQQQQQIEQASTPDE